MRKLPLDVEVACDVYYCELMMVLGQHAPFAAKNLTHPLRPGYYAEAERRFVAMQRVLYATTAAEVRAFVDNEHVKYFVYNTGSVGKLDGRLYHPAREQIVPAFNASKRKVRLLLKPPKEAVVFRDNERVLIDLDKLAIWAAAEETKKAAVQLEGVPVKAEDAGAIDAPAGALDVDFDANIDTRAERLRGLRRCADPSSASATSKSNVFSSAETKPPTKTSAVSTRCEGQRSAVVETPAVGVEKRDLLQAHDLQPVFCGGLQDAEAVLHAATETDR